MSFVSLGLQKIHEETRDGVYQEDIIRGSAGSMYAGKYYTTQMLPNTPANYIPTRWL